MKRYEVLSEVVLKSVLFFQNLWKVLVYEFREVQLLKSCGTEIQ
ncbi:MAG: hypothetical protein ACK4F9_01595 [Brevinematia bacterium]